MFRDKDEELERLTDELLEGEILPVVDEDILNDPLLHSLTEEAVDEGAEPLDGAESPDAPTEAPTKQKDPVVSFLTVLALLLMTGILGVLIWWLIQIQLLF